MDNLNNVMTLGEASKLYGVDVDTLKKACSGQNGFPPRFSSGECRKSGRYWLVTKYGMERVYGKNPQKNGGISPKK